MTAAERETRPGALYQAEQIERETAVADGAADPLPDAREPERETAVADGAADPTTKEKSMSLPHAGYFVKVTRPDGVTYEAMLQRYDGPHGALAVLYSEPADCPPGEELYEHTVKVAPLGLTEQPERLWRLELLDTPANREALVRRNVLALADEADRLAEDGHGWVTTSALRAVLGG